MSLYFGDNAVAGLNNSTIVTGFNILEHKWSDHLLNDIQWLRADTFSWQDGSVYVTAYNHLLADILNITAETETIGSYTVTFYRADDGHKICLADQETTVANIYTETGIAWYYILDTTNERFKLPRTKYGFEGLRTNVGDKIDESLPNITGTFTTINSWVNPAPTGCVIKNSTNITGPNGIDPTANVHSIDASLSSSTYQDNAPVQERATQMYLYFYVGEYSKTAVEQTAGITSEELNNKVDVENLVLLDGSLSMPSSKYIDLTLGASGTTYTAPANGWFTISQTSSNNGMFCSLTNTVNGVSNANQYYGGTDQLKCSVPALKGQIVQVYYSATSTQIFRFVYAEADV